MYDELRPPVPDPKPKPELEQTPKTPESVANDYERLLEPIQPHTIDMRV